MASISSATRDLRSTKTSVAAENVSPKCKATFTTYKLRSPRRMACRTLSTRGSLTSIAAPARLSTLRTSCTDPEEIAKIWLLLRNRMICSVRSGFTAGAGLNRISGHAKNNRCSFVLRQHKATGGLNRARAAGSIAAHSCEHSSDAHAAGVLRDRLHRHVDIRQIAFNPARHGVELYAARGRNAQMLPAGADVQNPGLNGLVVFRFLYADTGELRQLQRILRGERRGHMLHQNYRGREIPGEARGHAHDRGGSAGRGCKNNNGEAKVGASDRCRLWRRRMGRRGPAGGSSSNRVCQPHSRPHHPYLGRHAYFAEQFILDALHVEVNAAAGLGDKLDCAQFEGLQRAGRAFFAFRADNDNRTRTVRHDMSGSL